MKLIEIARACHEVNRAYCQAIGDDVPLPWHEAPYWQQKTVMGGVAFHLNNPAATPEASHESWMAEKRRTGWVWGPVKDADDLTHPCMVPYSELPVAQQVKDHLFKAVVNALASTVTTE